MWKKPPSTERDVARPDAPPKPAPISASPKPARIGQSLRFKGELEGEEDLVIEGSVEGKIVIKKASVTVGEKGRVEADIDAASIRVAGSVKGNLTGTDQVILLESGSVEGNIQAKSVTLENGARFKGSIDMDNTGSMKSAPRDAYKSSSGGTLSSNEAASVTSLENRA